MFSTMRLRNVTLNALNVYTQEHLNKLTSNQSYSQLFADKITSPEPKMMQVYKATKLMMKSDVPYLSQELQREGEDN